MGMVDDILKAFDRIPGWKRLQQVPSEMDELKSRVTSEVDELKSRVAALEENSVASGPLMYADYAERGRRVSATATSPKRV